MKKLLLILLCLPLTFSFGESEEKKDEYNFRPLKSIEEPCDCLDHTIELFKKGISKMKSDKDYNASNDLILEKQAGKIREYCEDQFGPELFPITEGVLANCDDFDEAEEIFQEISELSSLRK